MFIYGGHLQPLNDFYCLKKLDKMLGKSISGANFPTNGSFFPTNGSLHLKICGIIPIPHKEKHMKRLVEEVQGEGLESLLGERVTLLCINYFYTGKLVGVNETCVLLENPAIVYETGEWTDGKYRDEQALPGTLYVQTAAIESFGALNA